MAHCEKKMCVQNVQYKRCVYDKRNVHGYVHTYDRMYD